MTNTVETSPKSQINLKEKIKQLLTGDYFIGNLKHRLKNDFASDNNWTTFGYASEMIETYGLLSQSIPLFAIGLLGSNVFRNLAEKSSLKSEIQWRNHMNEKLIRAASNCNWVSTNEDQEKKQARWTFHPDPQFLSDSYTYILSNFTEQTKETYPGIPETNSPVLRVETGDMARSIKENGRDLEEENFKIAISQIRESPQFQNSVIIIETNGIESEKELEIITKTGFQPIEVKKDEDHKNIIYVLKTTEEKDQSELVEENTPVVV